MKISGVAAGLAAIGLVVLAGCGAPYQQSYSYSGYSSPSPYSNNKTPSNVIQVADDQYKPYIEYTSDVANEGPVSDSTVWVLVARKDRSTGVTTFYTQWGSFYSGGGWRFYFGANDSSATELEFREVGRDVGSCYSSGCSHIETYNIYFTPEQMAAGAMNGINYKVFAKDSSSKTETIPASLIKAMLDKVNAPAT